MPEVRFRRVFVMAAYVPNGGTYMAYHLGKILHYDFGLSAIAVTVGGESAENGVHQYDLRMPSVSIAEMTQTITSNDILIINPSFSNYLFGWRIPGFKLSYVQGFTTYSILDKKFDHFVTVSEFVRKHLEAVYDIKSRVIPAFINLNNLPTAPQWEDRPPNVVLPYRKGIDDIWTLSYERLLSILRERAPYVEFQEPIFGSTWMPQQELLSRVGRVRYTLFLSAAEGLPLVPLEAMAMETIVIGYDGFGGRHYMRPGINCAVAAYPEIERVAEMLIEAVSSPERAAIMVRKGKETASEYSYEAFRANWIDEFSKILAFSPN
jgi:glycosyltransferase involved in cell wall biosynthesis